MLQEGLKSFCAPFLDIIEVFDDELSDHVSHLKWICDKFMENKMYLLEDKMQIMPKELKVLGHVITDDGILMDPRKVDSVVAWKTPTNRDLLRGFLGSMGYLTDNIA